MDTTDDDIKDDYFEEMHLRIVRVTEDLRAIQRELNFAAMEAAADPELMEALVEWPQMEPIQLLRSSLDQMRHFLWFYTQVISNETEVGEKLRQTIRQQMCDDQLPQAPDVAERLRFASNTVMLNYLTDGKNRKPN